MGDRSNRQDWMLLLPASAALPLDDVLVLGGSDAMAQSLVDHGLARTWRRPTSPTDRAAFVVAWDECATRMDRIAGHVAPNGMLYLEIDRRHPTRRGLGPRSVERGLRRGGCRVFSAHLVTPEFSSPRRYLPLDRPKAIRWHLRALYVAGTPISRAVRAGLAVLMATPKVGASFLSWVAPRYIVIATAVEDDSPAVGIPMARGHERAIVVTSGYDQASRAVVLPFAEDGAVPRFAVKVASTPKTAVGTLRENERLISLHLTLPSHTARALPKPMGVFSLTGRTACVQSCAPGPSMSATVGRWRRPLSAKIRDLDAVVDWLTEFALATRVGVAVAERDWTLIYQDAAVVTQDTPEVVHFLAESQRIAKSTALGQYAVHQHYDAGPWNVHIDGAEPMLIDWETDDLRPADCLGPALADLLYLLTYWYFLTSSTASESEEEAAIVRLFATVAPADGAVVAARGAIDRALVSLGLERRVVPAALAALWAERALYTQRRRAILGVPVAAGQTRPEAFLRALAGAMEPMSETYDW